MKTRKDDKTFWVNLTRFGKMKIECEWMSYVFYISVLSLMS